MKIVTLLFACVALLTSANVGAMNNDSGAGRGRSGTARQNPAPAVGTLIDGIGGDWGWGHDPVPPNRHLGIDAMSDVSEAVHGGGGGTEPLHAHPDIGPWANHEHTHPTRILSPVPGQPRRPKREIRIKKVVDHLPTDYHLLQGELVHDYNILSCHSPHGYAIVDLNDSELLYACLKPFYHHQESINRERSGDPPVYIAVILQEGKPKLDADLVPRQDRSAFESRGLLFHSPVFRAAFARGPFGRVRYILPNATEVDGELYKYF